MPRTRFLAPLVLSVLALGLVSANAWSSGGGASVSARFESPVRAGKVFAPSRCINRRFMPGSIVYACADFSALLVGIDYDRWGHFKAVGDATDRFKNCPNKPLATCDRFRDVDARFKLFRPRYCMNV